MNENDQDGTSSPQEQASKLSAADLERVRQVTSTGIHAVERKPFRPWLLLGFIVGSIIILGQLSIWIATHFLQT
ncbi:MAG: DUF3094 family protein [Pseudomonadales bacterium]